MEEWLIYSKKADFAAIAQQFSISPMLARILRNRDVQTEDEIRKYLHGSVRDLYDPYRMKGVAEGVALTARTIREGGRIRIVGDYDVDGVCSAYILKTYLQDIGATVDVRLPDRVQEGYGMNVQMAEEAGAQQVRLLITCDNGISSFEAVRRARELGIRVIITDHHEPSDTLPDADVLIDPKQPGCTYPFRELCGAGVAYQFIRALDQHMDLHKEDLLNDLLQFAGMATIADIVPLRDENRILASEGIRGLRQTRHVGMNALIRERAVDKEQLNAGNIGFILGPCINSAGRLKNAGIAFDLLQEPDPQRAAEIAEELSMLNEERRFLTDIQVRAAFDQLQKSADDSRKILVLYLPQAHESVAGIVAGRIKDACNRPAIIVTDSESGLKGSGRSTDHYNMIESLRQQEDLFDKLGGHAKACGFTLKQKGSPEETVRAFSERINACCTLTDEDLVRRVWIDMQLPFKYVTEAFVQELNMLEPFGVANEKPVFAERDIEILSMQILGKNSNVLKLQLQDSQGYRMEGVMFGDAQKISARYETLAQGMKISMLYYPRINEFRGSRSIQLVISSIRPAGIS